MDIGGNQAYFDRNGFIDDLCPGHESLVDKTVLTSSCIITGDAEEVLCDAAQDMDFSQYPIASIQDSVCFPALMHGYISHYHVLAVTGYVVKYQGRLNKREASSTSVLLIYGMSDSYFGASDHARVR